jgi:peptide/nickel transport system permease protein
VRERIVPMLITLLLISIIVFVATHILGIDVALRVLGRQATPEQLAEFNRARGLDRPIYAQYFTWLSGMVRGDFGISSLNGRPVADAVLPRAVYAHPRPGGDPRGAAALDRFGIFLSRPGRRARELGFSLFNVAGRLPVFVIGILLIYFFSVVLG